MEITLDKAGRISRLKSLAKPLTNEGILEAVQKYEELNGQVSSYSESTGYDVAIGSTLYPPKTIFGLAMGKLLGMEVLSRHFTGGIGSPCFSVLEALGYEIRAKDIQLEIYQEYSRQNVNKAFDPDIKFIPGAGRWGGSGIVSNAPSKGDFVFFVTLEESEGNEYDDYFTEDGVLFWSSQSQHTPDSSIIKALVSHNEEENTISLFVRRNGNEDYTFLGPLSFKDWNPNSSNPVHFQWSIINWPLPDEVESNFKGFMKPAVIPGYQKAISTKKQLTQVAPPLKKGKKSNSTGTSKNGQVDWDKRDKNNRELGLAGEQEVLRYEKNYLIAADKPELAEKIEHVALVNSSVGYDIKSFNIDGTEKHIEVKTTTGSASTPFYISKNEVNVSGALGERYWIYRLYNFKLSSVKAEFYAINGPVADNFELSADVYKAVPK